MRGLIVITLATGLLFAATLSSPAAERGAAKAKAEAVKSEKKTKFRPFNGTVKTVDKSAQTITLQGEKAQQFKVTSQTKIQKNGEAATFDDVAVGDKVGGRAQEAADGKWEATSLNVGTKAVKSGKEKEAKS